MAAQRGQCPNFGGCSKAESAEVLVVEPGQEFRCPECTSKLKPVHTRGVPAWIYALFGVALIGVLGFAGLKFLHPGADHGFPALTEQQWVQLGTQIQAQLLEEAISFRPGQTDLSEDDREAIKQSLAKLEHFPRSRILVEAHVGPSDSPEADQKLSDERAAEVKKFLTVNCGIPESRVFAKGRGSNQPPERSSGESEQEWKRRARGVRILLVGP